MVLMDMAISRAGIRAGRDSIAAGNTRFRRAFRMLFYFSEVMPKKYNHIFAEDITKSLVENKIF